MATAKGLNGLKQLSQVAALAKKVPEVETIAGDGDISLALIDVHPQIRTAFPLTTIIELADNIRAVGLLQPVIVHAEENGRYRLIAGECRFRAVRMIHGETIRAIIKRGLTAIEIERIQISENNQRTEISPYDVAVRIAYQIKNWGVEETVKLWGRSEAWVSKRAGVLDYDDRVIELFKGGHCNDLEILLSLNGLVKIDQNQFDSLAERLKKGDMVTREEVRSTKKQAKNSTTRAVKTPAPEQAAGQEKALQTPPLAAPASSQAAVPKLFKEVKSDPHSSEEKNSVLTDSLDADARYREICVAICPLLGDLENPVSFVERLLKDLKSTDPKRLLLAQTED